MSPVSEINRRLRCDEHGHIAQSLPCVGCRYELRGLDPTGACPECGEPIYSSARSERLTFADVDWVKRLARGSSLVAWGTLAGAVQVGWGFRTALYELLLNAVVWFLLGMVVLTGYWIVTVPEPAPPQSIWPTNRVRGWVRALAVMLFLYGGWLAVWATQHFENPIPLLSNAIGVSLLMFHALVIGELGRQLAHRMGRRDLQMQAYFLPRVLVACEVLAAPIAMIQLWLRDFDPRAPFDAFTGLSVNMWGVQITAPLAYIAMLPAIVLVLGLIWGLVLMFRFAGALHEQARLARRE